jgi:hypothetical protein
MDLEAAVAHANDLARRGREVGWDAIPAEEIREALAALRTARKAVPAKKGAAKTPPAPADLDKLFGG